MLDTATRRCALPPTCGIAGDSNTILVPILGPVLSVVFGSTALFRFVSCLQKIHANLSRTPSSNLMSGSFGDRLRAAQMAKGIATVQTPSSSGGGDGGGGDVENERDRLAREAIEGKRAE